MIDIAFHNIVEHEHQVGVNGSNDNQAVCLICVRKAQALVCRDIDFKLAQITQHAGIIKVHVLSQCQRDVVCSDTGDIEAASQVHVSLGQTGDIDGEASA